MKMNKETKRAKGVIWSYNNAKCRSVHEAYKSPSVFKERAEKEILETMLHDNGYDYRITGASSSFFSCAYKTKDTEGKETLHFFTHCSNYQIEL